MLPMISAMRCSFFRMSAASCAGGIGERALLGDGMRVRVPARSLELRCNQGSTSISLSGHADWLAS
jgi:hypothetical protein